MTQTPSVRVIRTAKVPFPQSQASLPMLMITATVMRIDMDLPFSPTACKIGSRIALTVRTIASLTPQLLF